MPRTRLAESSLGVARICGDPAFRSHSAISPAGYSNARLMVKRE
jgi:hypothetical protein